jgi:hypothetical protein
MNERIRELSDIAYKNHLARNPHSSFGRRYDYDKEFAELIVQECMTMCDNVSADYFKHRKAADDFRDKNIYAEGESACDEVRYEIKKHFGVEE